MINRLEIQGYKNISEEDFTFSPITIFTGLNSTGKSTVLQSILQVSKETSLQNGIYLNKTLSSSFEVIRNKYTNASQISITCHTDLGELIYTLSREKKNIVPAYPEKRLPEYEKGLFYLSANRKGVENDALYSEEEVICGPDGSFIYSTYEKEKSKTLDTGLIKDALSTTLASQVNYWLKYILGLPIEFYTIKNSTEKVDIKFKSDSFDLMPSQLGSGVSYLVKILILCLRASKGDIILLENPEIHLHPGAQSRLADFFTMIANSGIQLVIETHCENLLNKFRYMVFKKELSTNDIIIYYKSSITSEYDKIKIIQNGDYEPDFPEGFFDATLVELLAME